MKEEIENMGSECSSKILKIENVRVKKLDQQKAVVQRVITKKGPFVLPMGCGRTMVHVFYAADVMNKIMIVIVLLVAPQTYIVRRGMIYGIGPILWKGRRSAGARLVLACAEQVLDNLYQSIPRKFHRS